MTPSPTLHLTTDELDAFHSGSLSRDAGLHLETCDACRSLAHADHDLISQLGRLPALRARAGFEDRIMARVVVGEPASVPILSYPRLSRRRVAALSALAAGLAISVAWSAANRALLDAWLTAVSSSLANAGWAAFRGFSAAAAEQSWFQAVQHATAAPGRLVLGSIALVAIFAAGLVVLRRLTSPSAATVPRAGV